MWSPTEWLQIPVATACSSAPVAQSPAVESELGAELIEAAGHAGRCGGVAGELGSPVAQQRPAGVLALGDDRFGVDRQPRLALCRQDVPLMEVAAGEHHPGLGPGQVIGELDRFFDQRPFARPAGAFVVFE